MLQRCEIFLDATGKPVIIGPDGNELPWPGLTTLGDVEWFTPEFDIGAAKRIPVIRGEKSKLIGTIARIPFNGADLNIVQYDIQSGPLDPTGMDPNKSFPGSGTGTFQIYFPMDALPLQTLQYSGHCYLYLEKGGENDYDGTVKMSLREFSKGYEDARAKLIFTFEGDEWSLGEPDLLNVPFKFGATITYFSLR
jgi:hypothetical protein